MKNVKLAVLSVAVVAALSVNVAMAADTGFYVGAGVVRDNVSLTQNFGSGLSFDRNETAGRVLFGYSYNPFLAAELGYADHGRHGFGIATVPSLGANSGNFKAESWTMAVVGTVPFGSGFSGFGKLGLSHNRGKTEFSGFAGVSGSQFSARDVRNRALLGVGLNYDINSKWAVRGGYDYFGKVGDSNNTLEGRLSQVALDAVYRF